MRPEFPIIYPIIYQTFPVKVLYLKKKLKVFSGGGVGGVRIQKETSKIQQAYWL